MNISEEKEKLSLLLKRRDKARKLSNKEKLRWKNEIIQLNEEIKNLETALGDHLLCDEDILLDIFALNKALVIYLYEKYVHKDSKIIDEFIEEILSGIQDYLQRKNREDLERAKEITKVLLDTVYRNSGFEGNIGL